MRIGLVEPTGQADPARNRIDFRNDVAILSENEVRPNYSWQSIANFFATRKFNQLFWFTRIEIARDPFRLFSFYAELIQLITGALKNKEPMPELLELGDKFPLDRK